MFNKKKVYAYENCEGDKGVIIARSLKKATEIFHEKYPHRKIAQNNNDYWDDGAYLFEVEEVKNNKLYCSFPW